MSNKVMEGHLTRCRPEYLDSPVYLSGPMSGRFNQNYPEFNKVTSIMRRHCLVVYNPAENFGGMLGLDRKEYMRQDIGHLLNAKSIVVLPGWDGSKGAKLEVAIARELDLPVWKWFPHDDFLEEVPIDE